MDKHLAAHPLMKNNFKYIKPLLDNLSEDFLKNVNKTGKIRSENPYVLDSSLDYHVTVFHKGSALIDGVERLKYAQRFINEFPNPRSFEEHGITQYTWLEYHYSYFLITYISLSDMALILTNSVFNLGNPEKNCRPEIIKRNKSVKNSPVKASLDRVDKIVSPFRNERNLYVHRGEIPNLRLRMKSETLDLLKLYSNVHLYSEPIVSLEIIDFVYQQESKNIFSELGRDIETINDALNELFSALFPVYETFANILKIQPDQDKK